MFSFITVPLGAFLTTFGGYLAARILASLGMGVIAYGSITIAINQLFILAQGHYNSFPVFALQVANLAGFGQAFGIISGAILFRLTFVFMARIGLVPK